MTDVNEPLDRLIRESLGEPVNPAPSRYACRAALRQVLAAERRHARRRQAWLSTAASLALVFLLASPLGSDSFDITETVSARNGHEIHIYSQGLRGDRMGTYGPDDPHGFSDAEVEHLLLEEAAGQVVPVEIQGWQLGSRRHFRVLTEAWSGEQWSYSDLQADGYAADFPRWLSDFDGKMVSLFIKCDEISGHRPPDFTTSLKSNGLDWNLKGWRIRLPGRPEIIYYFGERADGVRGH